MKTLFYTKTLIALAVAVAAAAANISQAQEKPIPPPSTENILPPDIAPNSPAAQVVKLVQAGVEIGVIKNFISNTAAVFGLDADQVIALNDVGVPVEIINAMMTHDKNVIAAKPVAVAPVVAEPTPPAEPITVNYFYDSLTPYGSWVEVEGYGRCWRPTVVVYDTGWRPYCDRGHWVWTDCGWYWDSDYSWGCTFHYGRWFRDGRYGWCWSPDTVWAPSWVVWRSCDSYRGWAPLPPLAVYRPGVGFFYRGENVSVDFSFGLGVDCFTFVEPVHFCDHHPRRWCPDEVHVNQFFNRTTIINNYDIHNTIVVNNGISVTQIIGSGHRPPAPVPVATLPNAGRQGWRGDDAHLFPQNPAGNYNDRQPRPLPVMHPVENRDARDVRNVSHQPAAAATQNSGGSVQIYHQPAPVGTVDTGHAQRELVQPERRSWSSEPTSANTAAPTPAENRFRSQPENPQPRFTPPVVAEHSAPVAEQRQFTAPTPQPVPERFQVHERPVEQHSEPRVESHQSHTESAPAASSSHESDHSSSQKSDRDKRDR